MSAPTFFIAGTIQGPSRGVEIVDQTYREELRKIIATRYPEALIFCPYRAIEEQFDARRAKIINDLQSMPAEVPIDTDDYPVSIRDLTCFFTETTRSAADFDVLVAYLPGYVPSMGTAMEMWCAQAARRLVVTITSMRYSLAVLATSDIIVPNLDAFAALLTVGGWMDRQLRLRSVRIE
jgi:hypothetical protein